MKDTNNPGFQKRSSLHRFAFAMIAFDTWRGFIGIGLQPLLLSTPRFSCAFNACSYCLHASNTEGEKTLMPPAFSNSFLLQTLGFFSFPSIVNFITSLHSSFLQTFVHISFTDHRALQAFNHLQVFHFHSCTFFSSIFCFLPPTLSLSTILSSFSV